MNIKSKQVSVLNFDYTFLCVVNVERAFSLIYTEKVKVLKYTKDVINTVKKSYFIPKIIRLVKYIRIIFKRQVPFNKKNVIIRDGYKCVYCGDKSQNLTIDHVLPKSRNGKTNFENCVCACKKCNTKKRNKTCKESNMYPKTKLVRPTIGEFMIKKMKKYDLSYL